MKNFEELSVWQEACKLAVEVYTVLNKSNDNGLKSQMQRAVVSIASNIAEGAERQSNKEFIQFLYIAKGSCAELRTQLYIAVKIQQITKNDVENLIAKSKHISSMLHKLITYLKNSTRKPTG